MNSLFVSYHDVRHTIGTDIFNNQMYAHAGISIDLMRYPRRCFTRPEFKPIKYRRLLGSRIPTVMGKITFSCNQIRMSVTIDVLKGQGMALRKCAKYLVGFPRHFTVLVF